MLVELDLTAFRLVGVDRVGLALTLDAALVFVGAGEVFVNFRLSMYIVPEKSQFPSSTTTVMSRKTVFGANTFPSLRLSKSKYAVNLYKPSAVYTY
jgi:hypothetical protein